MKNYKVFLKGGGSVDVIAHDGKHTVGVGISVLTLLGEDGGVIANFWEPVGFIVGARWGMTAPANLTEVAAPCGGLAE